MRYKEKARDGRAEYANRIADLSQVPQLPQPFPATPKSLGMD